MSDETLNTPANIPIGFEMQSSTKPRAPSKLSMLVANQKESPLKSATPFTSRMITTSTPMDDDS